MKTINILAGLLALTWISCASAETVERSSPADPRGEVEISNVAGNVHVIGWDRSEVHVTANLGSNAERLEIEHDGTHTTINVVYPKNGNARGTDLTVQIPRGSTLTTHTVSADQTIEEIRGIQRLQAVSGNVRTQVWSGEFEAQTVSGDINAKGQAGTSGNGASARVRVSSVSGKLDVSDLGDDLDLSTVSGDMKARAQNLTRARIRTTNGSVHLSAALARDARVDAESVNGDMTFTFGDSIDAEFDIETFNGDIENCFGQKAKRKSEHGPGNELRFKEGEGRGSVRVKTLNGKVNVCRTQRSSWRIESPRLVILG